MCVQPADRHFEVVLSVITVGVEFAWMLFCDVGDEFSAVNTDASLLLKNIQLVLLDVFILSTVTVVMFV